MAMFTTRHYEKVAAVLREQYEEAELRNPVERAAVGGVITAMARMFAKDNELFDASLFYRAAYPARAGRPA